MSDPTGIKGKRKNIFTDGWVWRMAWRDARHNFSRLFLFVASLITGIAAVVALDSLNASLQKDIDESARDLLGADLVINSDNPFDSSFLHKLDSTGLPVSSQIDMASMVLFMHNGGARLIRLVGVDEAFPFYGSFTTLPADAYQKIHSGNYAVLDESLASQYEVSSGDSVKIGALEFVVSGVVQDSPGGASVLSNFTPSVYISLQAVDSTGLIQFGSRVNYHRYVKTESEADAEVIHDHLRPQARALGYSMDTVTERREDLGEGFMAIYRFFSLLAFVALILGCIGVASSVHIYAREKRDEVAVLRCIGSSGWQAFNIYFIQLTVIGFFGSIAGSLIGSGLQQLVPTLAGDLIPVEASFSFSWSSIGMGVLLGTVVTVLFSMMPLVSIRFVPPLIILRSGFNDQRQFSKSKILVVLGVFVFPLAYAIYRTESVFAGLFFFFGLLIALSLLAFVAFVLLRLVKKFFPSKGAFVLRHALANLFRPNNQTQVLMVTIGLGAFIISTLNVVQNSLLNQVEFTGRQSRSNTVMYDIQPFQKEGVLTLLQENNLKVDQLVPIVTTRLREVNGQPVQQLLADTTAGRERPRRWALTREYRVTYRDTLHVSEKLIEGEIQYKQEGKDSVWVTISEGMLEDLNVRLGDSLVFDVQGIPVKVRISGVRSLEWANDPPNFIFVFPNGVLEEAPQFWVAATRIEDDNVANRVQRQLVMNYPNVSVIDLRLILGTINDLFDKLGLVIKFLALFSILTGLVVLAGAVVNSRFVRIRENALMRTVGARSSQIIGMTLIEYVYLGFFSAMTGIVLSIGGGWFLAKFFFEIEFAYDLSGMVIIGGSIIALTMLIGWWNLRDVIRTAPLQVLRREV